MLQAAFWGSTIGVIYAYVGYPILLWLFTRGVSRTAPSASLRQHPSVSMLVPVHNERAVIAHKLRNTQEIQYPASKLEVLYVSDGSTDGTPDIIAERLDGRSTLLTLPERGGKAAALNVGLRRAGHDIVVFSDASIMLAPDAIQEIVRLFEDPRIGCVSGEDRIAGGGGEGLYGRYELFLRRLESQLHSIVGASGSFYAQRRVLCEPFVPNVAPDFLSVLRTIRQGYRATTCPSAIGEMHALNDTGEEFRRKVRTVLRGITTLVHYHGLLNPFKYGLFSFELFSHKVARWLVPFFLLGMLGSSAALAYQHVGFAVVLLVQVIAYGLAVAGHTGPSWLGQWLPVKVAVYFSAVNLATLSAWLRFASGARQELWSPSRREGL
jgi:cellulose synthase/poly-beta-1,6-N-acetylglucosamine synthase-like glycosyltransferase